MCYSAKANIIVNAGYTFDFARLDGSGWAKFDDAQYPTQWISNLWVSVGGGSLDRIEQAWTLEDELTGKIYTFGWGSEGSGNFWDNAGFMYDPATPGSFNQFLFGPSFVSGGLHMQQGVGMYWRAGRRFGWFDPFSGGQSTQFTNFDNTQYKRLNVQFSGAGAPITIENANEGKSFVYIPHLGKLWGFRFAAPGFTVTEYDIDAITQINGVDWALPARDITAQFINNALLNEVGAQYNSGNMYTRLQYFPGGKVLVAHIDTTLPALYCRIP
jgi:hypothetical protein